MPLSKYLECKNIRYDHEYFFVLMFVYIPAVTCRWLCLEEHTTVNVCVRVCV